MTLQQLGYVVAISEEGSFNKAAERLYISQPSLSEAIKELEKELPGILAWLVRGCLKYQREGLKAPAYITQASAEYKVEEDTMQLFVEQCLEAIPADELSLLTDPEKRISATDLYEVYQGWYKKYVSPKAVPSMHLFGRQLSSKITKRKVGGLTWYYGYRLTNDGERFGGKQV